MDSIFGGIYASSGSEAQIAGPRFQPSARGHIGALFSAVSILSVLFSPISGTLADHYALCTAFFSVYGGPRVIC